MSTLSLTDGQILKFYVTGACRGPNDELEYVGIVAEVPYRHRFPCSEDVADFLCKVAAEYEIIHGFRPNNVVVLDWKRLLDD